jgi:predicted nucleic acid-binding protein
VVELTDEIIKEGAALRSRMLRKNRKLSCADCINYIAARKVKAKLLTSDQEFEDMKNVELVR